MKCICNITITRSSQRRTVSRAYLQGCENTSEREVDMHIYDRPYKYDLCTECNALTFVVVKTKTDIKKFEGLFSYLPDSH